MHKFNRHICVCVQKTQWAFNYKSILDQLIIINEQVVGSLYIG